MPLMPFSPSARYVHLGPSGEAQPIPGGESFWALPAAALDALGQDWLITEFECSADWPRWERHPAGDEFIYVLSGTAVMLLEWPTGVERVLLTDCQAVVVPRGVWHTAQVNVPSRMLFITRGLGTEHRDVVSAPAAEEPRR